MLDKIGNMIESTQYVRSLLIKPKNDSVVRQLCQDFTPVGAIWFSSVGVFVIPEQEESGSSIMQDESQGETRTSQVTSQVETLTPMTKEPSSKPAARLGVGRATIYRYILPKKPDNSVSP